MTLAEAIALRQRDPQTGLLVNQTYHFRADGTIDWKAMVDRKFMFVIDSKRDVVVKAQGKPIDECDLSLVDDRWLRIKQGGFNQLANLRGYSNLDYHSVTAADGKSAMVCTIEWIGNYETGMQPIVCAGVASASTLSVDKGFRPYLETFAENRAFARAVKRALQITILSEDEIDGEALKGTQDDSTESARPASAEPYETLKSLCSNRKVPISFEALKARAIKHNAELPPEKENERIKSDPALWTDWSSVQAVDVWLLTGKIKEADEAAAKAGRAKK
jgi:hypothetical protein